MGLDRGQALDLRHVLVSGVDLAPGLQAPCQPDGLIGRALQGFMFTCGPDHIRQAAKGMGPGGHIRVWPQHGSLLRAPPCEVIRHEDGLATQITISLPCGGRARLCRRWRMDPSRQGVTLTDCLENCGTSDWAPMIMYHLNFGGGQLTRATTLVAGRRKTPVPMAMEERHCCLPAPSDRRVRIAPLASVPAGVEIGFSGLDWLQTWRHRGRHGDVFSVEPASHDRRPREQLGPALTTLRPGEGREYRLCLRVPAMLP